MRESIVWYNQGTRVCERCQCLPDVLRVVEGLAVAGGNPKAAYRLELDDCQAYWSLPSLFGLKQTIAILRDPKTNYQ